jgi:all-trans-retinol dehydrogenase (NAD+)
MELKDKIVLITGGASGIGRIMVRLMLERKAKVIIWDINQGSINRTMLMFQTLNKFKIPLKKLNRK